MGGGGGIWTLFSYLIRDQKLALPQAINVHPSSLEYRRFPGVCPRMCPLSRLAQTLNPTP
jgi:hypothetical protein